MACALGRTIKRNPEKTSQYEDVYRALVVQWIKQTGLTYCYNVIDSSCKKTVPAEIGGDLVKFQELNDKIKQLEDDSLKSRDEIIQLTSKNSKLNELVSNLQGDLDDCKDDQDIFPEQKRIDIQFIYDQIFTKEKIPRKPGEFKKSHFKIWNGSFIPLLNTLSVLGATISKGQKGLITS